MQDVILFGASGYSGLELLKLLLPHPHVRVVAASSDRYAGKRIDTLLPGAGVELCFEPHETVASGAKEGQIAFLATPAKSSADRAPALLARGLKVIDLSGAFRLASSQAYSQWYGFEHPAPDCLQEAHYGLSEFFEAGPEVRLVANPGCYATAAILAVAPPVLQGLLDPGAPIIVDGKSGTTGAGKALSDQMLFSEMAENLRPYRVGRHQHTPEVERALSRVANREVHISFTAHLIPMRRGLLASAYLKARDGVRQDAVDAAFSEVYQNAPFVRYQAGQPPETASVRGNNFTQVSATLDERTGTICAFGAIDNLVKGAAGQAIQNLNALLGVSPSAGLLLGPAPTRSS